MIQSKRSPRLSWSTAGKGCGLGCMGLILFSALFLVLFDVGFVEGFPMIDGPGEKWGIHRAVEKNNFTLVRVHLLFRPWAVNSKKYGQPLLVTAIQKRNPQMIRFLLGKGASVNRGAEFNHFSPLQYAVMTRSSDEIIAILLDAGADPNFKDTDGKTALHYAMRNGFGVRLLLEHGADVQARDKQGRTPMHESPARKEDIELLKAKGLDINILDAEGKPPVYYTINERYCETAQCLQMVRQMLESGVDLNYRDPQGKSLLHYAAGTGRTAVAEMLIEAGLTVALTDNQGRTPLFDAVGTPNRFSLSQDSHDRDDFEDVVALLISKGVDAMARDKDGNTPLHLAASLPRPRSALALLKAGADINARNNLGMTPLHYAADSSINPLYDESLCGFLTERGADVNSIDSRGRTSLHIALSHTEEGCCLNYRENIEALMKAGADITIADYEGRTPVHYLYMNAKCWEWMAKPFAGRNEACGIRDKEGKLPVDYAPGRWGSERVCGGGDQPGGH